MVSSPLVHLGHACTCQPVFSQASDSVFRNRWRSSSSSKIFFAAIAPVHDARKKASDADGFEVRRKGMDKPGERLSKNNFAVLTGWLETSAHAKTQGAKMRNLLCHCILDARMLASTRGITETGENFSNQRSYEENIGVGLVVHDDFGLVWSGAGEFLQ
jgi:hypothetical protein